MKILAFDSSAKCASVAIAEDDRILSAFTADNGNTHSEVLLPMAEDACAAAGTTLAEIDFYAVTVGPGSFTGVRIGVATVKGLAFRYPEGENRNCVAVSTLEALGENLLGLDGIYCAVMDARRGEVYNALFRTENGKLVRLCKDRAISLSALAEELNTAYRGECVRLVGDGYGVAFDALCASGVSLAPTPALLRQQNAASVAKCALRLIKEGKTVSDRALSAVYLRLPQAERERLEREKANKEQE